MNSYKFVICLSVLLSAIYSVPAGASESNFKATDNYVTAKMRSARIPGVAVVIVSGDRIVYSKGYGKANTSGDPITLQTPFMIGSVSKPFTALAVMQLVDANKVELDVPVQKYISWFRVGDPKMSSKITIRQLLNQTSGIPQPQEFLTLTENDDMALERTVRSLAKLKLIDQPGKSFTYSNGNYNTLGLIVQEISGQTYEQYVMQHIFAPLEMRNSFVSQDEALQHGMAMGHRWWFGFPIAVTLPFVRAVLPSGYIISSAEDMAHFIIAQLNSGRYKGISILSSQNISLMHDAALHNSYGMGWESTMVNGRIQINHDGGVPNFEASVFFDPEKRIGVFVTANVCSALDAFSSPHGSSILDGSTVRAMSQSILSIATNQPLPDQGIGNKRLYVVFDLVLLALTIMILILVCHRSRFSWQSAVLHFVLPFLILYVLFYVPTIKVAALMYEPGLGYWLVGMAMILLLKGLLILPFSFSPRSAFSRKSIL